jgi:hypothetical protein
MTGQLMSAEELAKLEVFLPYGKELRAGVSTEQAEAAIEKLLNEVRLTLRIGSTYHDVLKHPTKGESSDWFVVGMLMVNLDGKKDDPFPVWDGSLESFGVEDDVFNDLFQQLRLLRSKLTDAKSALASSKGGRSERAKPIQEAFMDWFATERKNFDSKSRAIDHVMERWEDWLQDEGILDDPRMSGLPKKPGKRTFVRWIEGIERSV